MPPTARAPRKGTLAWCSCLPFDRRLRVLPLAAPSLSRSPPPATVMLGVGQCTCPRTRCLPEHGACGRCEVRRGEVWCGGKRPGGQTLAGAAEGFAGGGAGNWSPERGGVVQKSLPLPGRRLY